MVKIEDAGIEDAGFWHFREWRIRKYFCPPGFCFRLMLGRAVWVFAKRSEFGNIAELEILPDFILPRKTAPPRQKNNFCGKKRKLSRAPGFFLKILFFGAPSFGAIW
ncbi:MAG: hypothetical protein ACR2P5_07445 [Gammaproteobacteria bacterium]